MAILHWPRSIPDYRWPAALLSLNAAPRRLWLAAVFHLSHLFGRFAGIFASDSPAILIIRTDGLGDAVLAEPLMTSLSRRFAGQKLILWAPAAICELMKHCGYLARLLEIPRGFKEGSLTVFSSIRWRAVMGYRLGRWKFATAIYIAQSPEPLGNWLLASAGAKERWYNPGNTENQFPQQQSRTVGTASKVFSSFPSGHELNRNAYIASQWGEQIDGATPQIYAQPSPAVEAQWNKWQVDAAELGALRLVGLVVGTAESAKEYPQQNWAQVAKRLWNERREILALIGGPGDVKKLNRLGALLAPTPHLRLTTPLPLSELACLIGRLDGLLSVDTGLAHIALAQEVPSVILVGGGHPGRFLPWPISRRATILNHRMPCEGCLNRCILATPECVTLITPNQIADAWANLSPIQKTLAAA